MKNSFLNITGLVVLIATLATFICSATVCAETQKKFAYNRTDDSEAVYSWDESQQYLTPELKYEFKRDKEGTLIEKKAYRWDIFEQNWKPYYLMTFHHKGYEHSIELARWDNTAKDFTLNPLKTTYYVDITNEVLSYTTYNWNTSNATWEQNQHLLLQEYLADTATDNK